MCQRDGSDTASKWIELLPNDDLPNVASLHENYMARSMAVHEARSSELLRKATGG